MWWLRCVSDVLPRPVHIGNGDGTFSSAISNARSTDPRGIALGDFNGDGVVDLVSGVMSGTGLIAQLAVTTTTTDAPPLVFQPIDLSTATSSLEALTILSDERENLQKRLSSVGASESRILSSIRNLETRISAYAAAESRIRDVDISVEAAKALSLSIRQQASAAVLAQANQQPSIALTLLES